MRLLIRATGVFIAVFINFFINLLSAVVKNDKYQDTWRNFVRFYFNASMEIICKLVIFSPNKNKKLSISVSFIIPLFYNFYVLFFNTIFAEEININ